MRAFLTISRSRAGRTPPPAAGGDWLRLHVRVMPPPPRAGEQLRLRVLVKGARPTPPTLAHPGPADMDPAVSR